MMSRLECSFRVAHALFSYPRSAFICDSSAFGGCVDTAVQFGRWLGGLLASSDLLLKNLHFVLAGCAHCP